MEAVVIIEKAGPEQQETGVAGVLILVIAEDVVADDEVIARIKPVVFLERRIDEFLLLRMELEEAVEILQVEKPREHRCVRMECLVDEFHIIS